MFNKVDQPLLLHKHPIRGDANLDIKKVIIGNTVGYIHSPIANYSEEEKKQWFESEKVKGNQILKEIEVAVNACYQD